MGEPIVQTIASEMIASNGETIIRPIVARKKSANRFAQNLITEFNPQIKPWTATKPLPCAVEQPSPSPATNQRTLTIDQTKSPSAGILAKRALFLLGPFAPPD